MRRPALVAFAALFGSGCDALDFDVSSRMTPHDAGFPDVPATPPDAPAEPRCAAACVGGRRCVEGSCTPHWLPIEAPEGINDAPRIAHFVVWTGREVILWGGRAPDAVGQSFGDGVRFDPTRGELRAMSRVAAPSARFQDGDTAVWTGHEMLVLGGRDGVGAARDGASYSPELDRWRALPPLGAARAPLSAVFTGHEVLVLGSTSNGIEGLRLPIGSDAFLANPVRSVNAPRSGHSALWTGAEVLVWGGADDLGVARADGYRYVPTRGRWRAVRDAGPTNARRAHSAVWSSSEMLVFGGVDRAGRALAAPVSYVPAVDAWRALSVADAPSPRQGQSAVWSGDAMIVWGGRDGSGVLADGAAYDPWDDAWAPLPALPPEITRDGNGGRVGAAAVWTGAEFVLLAGVPGGARLPPFGWRYQP